MKPVSVTSTRGSRKTKSPTSMPRASVSSLLCVRASRRTSIVSCSRLPSRTLGLVCTLGLVSLHGAAIAAVVAQAVDGDVLAFDGLPGIAAELGQHQPAVALDLADHRAQRVHVGGQGARARSPARPASVAISAPLLFSCMVRPGRARAAKAWRT